MIQPPVRTRARDRNFGNLSLGTLKLVSLIAPSWLVPAAVAGGLYYGLAGLGHLRRRRAERQGASGAGIDLLIAAAGGIRYSTNCFAFLLARAEPRRQLGEVS